MNALMPRLLFSRQKCAKRKSIYNTFKMPHPMQTGMVLKSCEKEIKNSSRFRNNTLCL